MIEYTQASGEDIERVIGLIEEATEGAAKDHIQMGCIAVVLALAKKDISTSELIEGVRTVSEYIAHYIHSLSEPVDPKKVN